MAAPLPLLSAPNQKELTLPDGQGYEWTLPEKHSSHICMGVEIDSPADPFASPTLKNHVPGWPTLDTAVLYDNNKAQRNMIYPKMKPSPNPTITRWWERRPRHPQRLPAARLTGHGRDAARAGLDRSLWQRPHALSAGRVLLPAADESRRGAGGQGDDRLPKAPRDSTCRSPSPRSPSPALRASPATASRSPAGHCG